MSNYNRVLRNNFLNENGSDQTSNENEEITSYDMMTLDPEVEKELREAFSQFDKDNGEIDKYDLQLLLRSMGRKCDEEELNQIMATVDTDGSGTIDYEEFKNIACEKIEGEQLYDREEAQTLFQYFDQNGDGFISFEELYYVLNAKMGLGFSKRNVEDMIKYCDVTGDELITFEEFFSLLSTKEARTPRYMRIHNEKEKKSKQSLWGRFSKMNTKKRTKPRISSPKVNRLPLEEQSKEYATTLRKKNTIPFFLTEISDSELLDST